MKTTPSLIAALLSIQFLCSVATAKESARQFVVNDSTGRDTVRFVLDAPFEVINGNTNEIAGKFVFEKGKLSGTFKVPVKSLKTGIARRDEHLQNDLWLDAAKNPTLELAFKDVKVSEDLWKGKEQSVDVMGEFQIHGTKRQEKVKLVLRYLPADENTAKRLPGNLLRAKADFTIVLANYKIAQSDSKVKELLGLKVGESAAVTVDLMASDAAKL